MFVNLHSKVGLTLGNQNITVDWSLFYPLLKNPNGRFYQTGKTAKNFLLEPLYVYDFQVHLQIYPNYRVLVLFFLLSFLPNIKSKKLIMRFLYFMVVLKNIYVSNLVIIFSQITYLTDSFKNCITNNINLFYFSTINFTFRVFIIYWNKL